MKNFLTKKDAINIFALAVFLPTAVLLTATAFGADKWLALVITQICAVGAVAAFFYFQKINVKEIHGLTKPPKSLKVLLIAVLSLSLILFVNPVQNWFTQLLELLGYTPLESAFDIAAMGGGELCLAVIFICITPALWEEFVFRGVVLEGCRTKKMDFKAIFFAAALFMLLHMSVEQVIHPLLMGVVLGVIYCATNSLWNAVLLHFFNNLFIVILSAVQAVGDFVTSSWWLMFPALIIAAAILFYIWKKRDDSEYLLPEEKIKKTFGFPLVFLVSIAFCVVMIAYGAAGS